MFRIIPQASSAAGKVDSVFIFMLIVCAAFLVMITAALLYFVIRYNRKRNAKAVDIEGSFWLETVWTITPIVIFLLMFYFGWTNFSYMRNAPREAMSIDVTGRQWAWSFKYPNGKTTSELLLAADRPVKLELHSLDVLHGFFIPAFRIKEDVVPGKNNFTWFVPTQLGSFDIECTVICGVSHAKMLGKATVVPVSDFEAWYFGDEDAPLPGQVRKPQATRPEAAALAPALSIMNQKFCSTCHSIDGTALIGPSFKGMYGKVQTVLDPKGKPREVTVDDAYLTRAISDPAAEVLKGYPPSMPMIPMTADETAQIVAYIKTLK